MLEGEKVLLREIRKEDLDWIFEEIRDFKFRKFLGSKIRYLEITKEGEEEWLDEVIKEVKKGEKFLFVIVSKEKNEPAGLIEIRDISFYDGTAEIGYWIRKKFWGRGYATEAVKIILEFCKTYLKLRKVIARVYSENKASLRVLEKNNFEIAGRLRKHVYIPGIGYDDEIILERSLI